MTTFTETQHPRAAAGTSDGGKFVAKARTEPDVDLLPTPAFAEIAERAMGEVNLRRNAHVGDPFDTAALQLRALSAMVKDVYPDSSAFRVECSDQAGSDDDVHVLDVRDANGNVIDSGDFLPLEGKWEDDSFDMGYDLWRYMDGQPGVRDMLRNGTAIVDIQPVLDGTAGAPSQPDGPAPDNGEAAAARGADMLIKYQALHDVGEDSETALRDLLADLHHWARANGVDLHEQFDAAERYANDEENEAQA